MALPAAPPVEREFGPSERGPAPNELQLWEVVGGVGKGGIFVRLGSELTSPEAPTRLSTGALIREAETRGNRLRFGRLTGTGPSTGWVNIKNSDKDLLVKVFKPPEIPAIPPPLPWVDAPVGNRKLRILGLHGRVTNSNILKFQVAPLKKELGKDVEWLFLDAPMAWDLPEYPDFAPSKSTELDKRLAKDVPLLRWFWIHNGSHNFLQTYAFVEDALDRLKRFLEEQAPIDAIVTFSQGTLITCMLLAALQREGAPVPWRLNVFFCGGWIRDPVHTFLAPSPQPTIQVSGGESDPYFLEGEPTLEPYFSDIVRIEHSDGHVFPTTQPRASEIIKEVAERIRERCGVSQAE